MTKEEANQYLINLQAFFNKRAKNNVEKFEIAVAFEELFNFLETFDA